MLYEFLSRGVGAAFLTGPSNSGKMTAVKRAAQDLKMILSVEDGTVADLKTACMSRPMMSQSRKRVIVYKDCTLETVPELKRMIQESSGRFYSKLIIISNTKFTLLSALPEVVCLDFAAPEPASGMGKKDAPFLHVYAMVQAILSDDELGREAEGRLADDPAMVTGIHILFDNLRPASQSMPAGLSDLTDLFSQFDMAERKLFPYADGAGQELLGGLIAAIGCSARTVETRTKIFVEKSKFSARPPQAKHPDELYKEEMMARAEHKKRKFVEEAPRINYKKKH